MQIKCEWCACDTIVCGWRTEWVMTLIIESNWSSFAVTVCTDDRPTCTRAAIRFRFQVWNCIFCCRHTPSINTNVRERTNNKRFSLPNTKTNGNKKFVHKTEEKKVKFKSSESKCARGTIRKFNLLIMIKYTKYNRTRIVLFFRVQSSSLVVACGARPLAAVAQCSSSWSFLYRFFCNFFSPFIRAHIIKLFHSNIFSFASTFSSEMPCNRRILINLFQTVFDFDGHEKKKKTAAANARNASERRFDSSLVFLGCVGWECGIPNTT